MPKASELKRGAIVDINGAPHAIKQVEAKSPSSRGAATLYKIRFTNLITGQKLDESYKGDDLLKDAHCNRVPVQYSYCDGDVFTFMDSNDYTPYDLDRSTLEGQIEYLSENLDGLTALVIDDKAVAIELPQSVILTIVDTAPGIKGATATGRTKPATTNTGLEVQVPEYLGPGEEIKVSTTTGKFMSRA